MTRLTITRSPSMRVIIMCTVVATGGVGCERAVPGASDLQRDNVGDSSLEIDSTVSALQTGVDKVQPRKRLGRGRSPLDDDPAVQALLRAHPRSAAWALRNRLDRFVSADPLEASTWEEIRAKHVSTGQPLEALWPAPRVVPINVCPEESDSDCDPDEPLRYEIADPSPRIRSQIRLALFAHVKALVDEQPVFGVSAEEAAMRSTPVSLHRSILGFRMGLERKVDGYPVYGGPQRVLFDADGGIRAITKGFITSEEVNEVRRQAAAALPEAATIDQARNHVQQTWRPGGHIAISPPTTRSNVQRTYDAALGRLIDVVELSDEIDRGGHVVHVDVETGEIYTDYPREVAFTDARLERAVYTSGNLLSPFTYTSTSVYTRDDNELVHDFFHVMSDRRCDNGSLENCPTCSGGESWGTRCSDQPINHCREAYQASQDGAIRASRRSARDFDVFGGSDATEGHAYFWAREYMQWQKAALAELGLLPSSAADYTQALIIVNACRPLSYVTGSGAFVRTNKSSTTDSLRRVFFRNYPFESVSATDFEFDFVPSAQVVGHELNHFVMGDYLEIDSGINCGGGDENRLFHEGVLGTVLPHRHWHAYYGIGYSPSTSSRLWFSNSDIGRVHEGTSGLLTRSTNPCSSGDPYGSGRVLGQALWKLAFGRDYNSSGSQLSITPLSKFVQTVYLSAMSADNGTLEEFAWMVAALARHYFVTIDDDDVRDWCTMFGRHGLDDEFTSSCDLW